MSATPLITDAPKPKLTTRVRDRIANINKTPYYVAVTAVAGAGAAYVGVRTGFDHHVVGLLRELDDKFENATDKLKSENQD